MSDEIVAAFEGTDPSDIPESVDRAAIARMRTVAMALDEAVSLPLVNYRIGLDPVLSAIPGIGDALSAGISLYIVVESARLGVSFSTLLGMLGRIAVDAVGGSIPVVGSVFDAVYKTNKWNVEAAIGDLFPTQTDRDDGDEHPEAVDIPVN